MISWVAPSSRPAGHDARAGLEGPLTEQGIALLGKAGRSPAAFDRRLGKRQGGRHCVDPVEQMPDRDRRIGGLDVVIKGEPVQPRQIILIQRVPLANPFRKDDKVPTLAQHHFVGAQHQRQHGTDEDFLAGIDRFDGGQTVGKTGQKEARHAGHNRVAHLCRRPGKRIVKVGERSTRTGQRFDDMNIAGVHFRRAGRLQRHGLIGGRVPRRRHADADPDRCRHANDRHQPGDCLFDRLMGTHRQLVSALRPIHCRLHPRYPDSLPCAPIRSGVNRRPEPR